MADEEGGGGGDFGIKAILAFFGIVFALWVMSQNGSGGVFGGSATSTGFFGTSSTSTEERDFEAESTSITLPDEPRAPREIEEELSQSSSEIDRVREDLQEAKLWGVLSPYKGQVRLSSGNMSTEDADQEYLSLYAGGDDAPITVTGWTLESVVSGVRVTLPHGTRLARHTDSYGPIVLEPNERAYVSSGESPLGNSFHENMCSGYLTEFQEFTPSLSRSCPYPQDDMERFASIRLDDDTCYEAIRRVSSCTRTPHDVLKEDLTSECRTFLEDDLTYDGCVKNHQYDPFFYKGDWRIYLESRHDLWRTEREIIRLLDTEGKTVDVLRY